jgi:tRNA-splicing ligase RtcB
MGRNQAKGKKDRRTGKQLTEGLISPQAMKEWIEKAGVELRGGDVDEAPQAYKRIEKVLEAHAGTIEILHTLTPIGVCMADKRNHDPYRD